MKTDLSKIDPEAFIIKDCVFGGDPCVWITPQRMGVPWTPANLHLRSSIWRKSDGEAVSLSFRKFFNLEERPDLETLPKNLHGASSVEKLDGSCLILTKYKGELIKRTRGSLADNMKNGHELATFLQRYPKLFNNDKLNSEEYSILTEWTSPENVIVLKYQEKPELKLIGLVHHKDYSYATQDTLDQLAAEWDISRPKRYKFDTLQDLVSDTLNLVGDEGRCLYYSSDQHIRKIKSTWYLKLHAFKSEVSLKNMVTLYDAAGYPGYQQFVEYIEQTFDFECLQMSLPLISQIADAMRTVNNIIDGMNRFVARLKGDRKQNALDILAAYGNTNRSDIVFNLLDGKALSSKHKTKLLFQSLVEGK